MSWRRKSATLDLWALPLTREYLQEHAALQQAALQERTTELAQMEKDHKAVLAMSRPVKAEAPVWQRPPQRDSQEWQQVWEACGKAHAGVWWAGKWLRQWVAQEQSGCKA